MFNQDHLRQSFIEQKAFLFKPPWFDWQLLKSMVKKAKQAGQQRRSSNYRSTVIRNIRLPSHIGEPRLLQSNVNTVERAVLACNIIGEDAMPNACLSLYEKNPSRDLWKASMLTWLEQVHSKCSGSFNHYYLKCTLDRAFAVRTFNTGTISWWPTECPAYVSWYKLLYPDRSLTTEEKFQVLCTTYITLNQEKNHYHARSTGTDLLDEEGKERKASWRRRGLITATRHARHTPCNNAFYRAVLASNKET